MIRYIYADSLSQHKKLADTMFRDRAEQFHTRLKWEVSVDENGHEKDAYDALNPLYVIWEQPDGSHGGSMRFLPTTGRTMTNEHFLDLTDGVTIESPLIWECTRFCVSQNASNAVQISALLMMAGAQLGQSFYLRHAVGVFDARMIRVYRRLGWVPDILGTSGKGSEAISVGLWEFSDDMLARLQRQVGVSADLSNHWLDRAMSLQPPCAISA